MKIDWRKDRKLDYDKIRLLVHDYNHSDATVEELCEKYDISRRTFYKYLREAESGVGKR